MGLGLDRDHLYERRLREQQPAQTHFQGQDAIKRLNDAIKPVQEQPNQNPKTYCMDFDGVLHQHETGQGPGPLGEPLSPGLQMAKRIKAAGHKLVILTARPRDQHHTIHGWLKGHGVRADEVTNVKPPAEMYIDDRAEHWPRNAGANPVSEGGPGSGPQGGKSKLELKRDLEHLNAKIDRLQRKGKEWRHLEPKADKLRKMIWGSESKESRILKFGENSGDGSMNMLDGHRYKSLATHEGGPGSGPKGRGGFQKPLDKTSAILKQHGWKYKGSGPPDFHEYTKTDSKGGKHLIVLSDWGMLTHQRPDIQTPEKKVPGQTYTTGGGNKLLFSTGGASHKDARDYIASEKKSR